jgi:hypothetical protein
MVFFINVMKVKAVVVNLSIAASAVLVVYARRSL